MIDGFRNERMSVVPRPLVAAALSRPVTRRLVVTDAGMFPDARSHERDRPRGAEEAIVIVCTGGAGWVEVAGARFGVGRGSAVVLPSGTPHRYAASGSNPWTIWWCHLRGTDVPELVAATGAGPAQPVLALQNIERCIASIDEILTIMERGLSPVRMQAAAGAAWKLLTQIAFDCSAPAPGDPLHRAMDHLAERIDGAVSVVDLAAMVGVSPSHLGALFRAATGGGVLAYHTGLRMARARQLLDGTDLAVGEVASALGYQDALYFSRRFRSTHGMSPTQYREQRKG